MQLCFCIKFPALSQSLSLSHLMSDCFPQLVCLCSKQKASRNVGSPWTTGDSCTSKIHWYVIFTDTYSYQKYSSIGISLYFKHLDAWVTMVQFLGHNIPSAVGFGTEIHFQIITKSKLPSILTHKNNLYFSSAYWFLMCENFDYKQRLYISYQHNSVGLYRYKHAWLTCQQCERWTVVNT